MFSAGTQCGVSKCFLSLHFSSFICLFNFQVVPVRMCDFDLASNTFGHTRDSITTPELQTPVSDVL